MPEVARSATKNRQKKEGPKAKRMTRGLSKRKQIAEKKIVGRREAA